MLLQQDRAQLGDDGVDLAGGADLAVVEHDRLVADPPDQVDGVGHEHDRAALGLELLHALDALALEALVADGEDLVDEQDLGIDVDGDGEAEAHEHAARVVLDLLVDEGLELGERHDRVEVAVGLLLGQAEDRGVQVDVLAAGQLRVETGAELEQRGDAAAGGDGPLGRAG